MLASGNNQDVGAPSDTLTPDGHDIRGLPENQVTLTATPTASVETSGNVQSLDILSYWWVLLILLIGIVGVWFITKRK